MNTPGRSRSSASASIRSRIASEPFLEAFWASPLVPVEGLDSSFVEVLSEGVKKPTPNPSALNGLSLTVEQGLDQ